MSAVEDTLAELHRQCVIPVLRCATSADAIETARALGEGGLRVVEFTLSTPRIHDALALLGGEGLTVGLGTLHEPEQIDDAVAAGASFVVSFARPPGFVAAAAGHDALAIPAGLTPTELLAARQDGARMIKLFPAETVGPAYVRHVNAVLPRMTLMATGGISTDAGDIAAWLDVGVAAVGIGSQLGTVDSVGRAELIRRAQALAAIQHPIPGVRQ